MTVFPQRAHTAKLTQRIKNKRYVSYGNFYKFKKINDNKFFT